MSSCTISGHANIVTGEVTFEGLCACLVQSACILVSGANAWQVKLIMSGSPNDDCNDTFYSDCLNVETGEFRITVPNVYVFIANDPVRVACAWKINPATGLVWSYSTYQYIHSTAVDDAGNMYLAGVREGGASIWKLNSIGVLLWKYDTGDDAHGVDIDSFGNVFVVGNKVGSGVDEKSVWKLSSSGSLLDFYSTGDNTWDVVVDGSDNVYVAGNTFGGKTVWKLNNNLDDPPTWTYGTGIVARGITLDSSGNVYVAELFGAASAWKLNSSGGLVWSNNDASNGAYHIAVDSGGNVYVAGEQAGNASVWKINSSGDPEWDRNTGAKTYGITVNGDDNIYAVGVRVSEVSIWGFNPDGDLIYEFDTGGTTRDIAADVDGILYAGGLDTTVMGTQKISTGCNLLWGFGDEYGTAYGIDSDIENNVYVATNEGGNKTVYKISSTGEEICSYYTGNDGEDVAVGPVRLKDIEDIILSGTDPVKVKITGHLFFTGETVRLIDIIGICPTLNGNHILTKVDADYFTLDETNSSDHSGTFVSGTARVDGFIYLAGLSVDTTSVWKLTSAGSLIWTYDTGNNTYGIDVDNNGYVYVVGTEVGNKSVWKLHDLGETVELTWSEYTNHLAYGVAVDSSGNVIVVGVREDDESVWKLNSDGSPAWSRDTGADTYCVAVDASGSVYVGTSNTPGDSIQTWNSAGTPGWTYSTGRTVYGIFVDSFGDVYAAGGRPDPWGDNVFQLNNNGSLIWSHDAGGSCHDIVKGCML